MAGRLKRTALFSYRAGKTILHRTPAGLKLVLVIIISALALSSLYGLAVSIIIIFLASAAARIPPYVLLKGSKPLFILSLCIMALNFIKEDFYGGLINALRIFVPFSAAALLFSVTTMRELRLSLAFVEKKITSVFSPGRKNTLFFSLGISLMLGFIPRFFAVWDDANLACDSRSCRRGLRRLPLLLPLVTELMMEASANTALALEARAYGSLE
jgi:energy-coupling factor transporter transmembrane protein EcfT